MCSFPPDSQGPSAPSLFVAPSTVGHQGDHHSFLQMRKLRIRERLGSFSQVTHEVSDLNSVLTPHQTLHLLERGAWAWKVLFPGFGGRSTGP